MCKQIIFVAAGFHQHPVFKHWAMRADRLVEMIDRGRALWSALVLCAF